MDVNELMQQTRDSLTVTRLFGEPHERNGSTVIPVAVVRGGGGGGRGEGAGPDGVGTGSGSGGGFALAAKPAGVFVVDGNRVSFRPAVDVNRIILGGRIVAIVALLVVRSTLRRRWTVPSRVRPTVATFRTVESRRVVLPRPGRTPRMSAPNHGATPSAHWHLCGCSTLARVASDRGGVAAVVDVASIRDALCRCRPACSLRWRSDR